MRFSARSLVSGILSFVLGLILLTTPAFATSDVAFAQTPPPKQDLHNLTQTIMIEVSSSLSCMLAGVDTINPKQQCLGINNGKIGPVDSKGGALGVMGNLIAATFTPPFHTGDYVRYLAGNFGITKPAYAQAQGIGFQGLSPLINIWTAFRNITYLLFVLIFIIIGFAIMLRVKIDPRTVMSIENQIPKIIIGLILVTFSFAIVGLLIDLMWVAIYLSISVFANIPGVNLGANFANVQGLNALEIANNISGGVFGLSSTASSGIGGFIAGLFNGPGGSILAAIILGAAGAGLGILGGGVGILIGSLVGGVIGGLTGSAALGLIGSVIAFLIIAIAILWALFRLWFTLIKAYVMILVVAVFSPFWILAGLLPGSRLTFGNLLRELGSNLISFPATIIMFMLGKTFIDVFEGPGAGSTFVPPLIGNPGDYKAIGAIVGLGIILLTPDVNKMMRKALQAPEFDFAAIWKAIGVGTGYPIGVMKSIGGTIAASKQYDITNVTNTPGQPSQLTYGPRGTSRAFFGRIFGGR